MISNTFCILPWIHLYANPDGNVLPCCVGDYRLPLGNVQKNTIKEVWNSDKFKDMRLNMLAGKKCNECVSCYNDEEANNRSFRQSSNKQYSEFLSIVDDTNDDGSLDNITLKYLDIRWSNICNFKCRSCSGTYSSSLAKEEARDKIYIFAGGNSNDFLYKQIEPYLSSINEIYFAGGEPLLMDKHYEILNTLIDTNNTDIKIRYNTNLSSLKYKDIVVTDLWKEFSNLHVSVSLDSWSERAEYIREGTDWNRIISNLRFIKQECPQIHIGIASVISVFNVYTLPDFIEYMNDNDLIDKDMYAVMYSLINPNFYSFNIFPNLLKQQIIDKLTKVNYNTQLQTQINNVISLLKKSHFDPALQVEFKKNTEHFDSIRNKSFIKTFPELKNFYEGIQIK